MIIPCIIADLSSTLSIESELQQQGVPRGEWELLVKQFAWHSPIPELLATTEGGHDAVLLDYALASGSVPRPIRFDTGPVCLIGDAAFTVESHYVLLAV